MKNKSNSPEATADNRDFGGISEEKETRSRGSREVHNLLEDIENFVSETTSLTAEELARAKEKLGERLGAARESLEEMGSEIVRRTRKGATATNEYVHEQPWKAIGAGAAVAFLLGFILARR